MSTEKPLLELIEFDHLIKYEWKSPKLIKKLKFNQEKCNGCGLCIKVCPVNAIMLGPVKEVASGEMEAPLIIIDETKCIACPLCMLICPFNAITLEFENEPQYPKVKGKIEVDKNKCIPCLLCEKICPVKAVETKINIAKKDELVKYTTDEKWAEGSIEIDKDKCIYCGLCEKLCEAIKIFWTEPKPPDFKPALDIIIDESKCDYCKLCEEICPVEAIKVECTASAPREITKVKVSGEITIDENKCIYCGLCDQECPVEAINVIKIFEGEIDLVNLDKCDPSGCKNCVNICPANSIYVPKKEKGIRISEKSCIYCGACENACPEDVIKVRILDLRIEEINNLWSESIKEHLMKVIEGYEPPKPYIYARNIKPPEIIRKVPESAPVPPTPEGYAIAKKAIDELLGHLKSSKTRALLEAGKIEKLREIIV
ncbi:MAG: ferredoxin [Candidatus Methanomethylicota archaeon]|uniref:Ferredoxin n=1 Tax=Thermoproteota archaeon TaxID=2056631 RepID=A0A497EWD1_9CREN|nr:MAG: ferredoxin [Candidatus Verstraetearchaeota archaeon]